MNEIISPKRAKWADRIGSAFRKTLDAIFETGRLLIEAKEGRDKLPHGEFIAMIESDLPFSRQTAFRLMAVASDKRLANVTHGQHLPPSWRTLYELTKLDDQQFKMLLKEDVIRPDMERKDIARWMRRWSVEGDRQRVMALTPVKGKFRTLVVDPPWDYGDLSLAGRAKPLYAVMSQEELREDVPVEEWAEDEAHLYVWTTNNFLGHAYELIGAWGFSYKTALTWAKPRWGLGSYFRNQTEHVLFGVRGDLRTQSDSISTLFEAPMGEHSEKPERFYEIVREASYPPFGEAFQRVPRSDFKDLYRKRRAAA